MEMDQIFSTFPSVFTLRLKSRNLNKPTRSCIVNEVMRLNVEKQILHRLSCQDLLRNGSSLSLFRDKCVVKPKWNENLLVSWNYSPW